jgi:tripartite-type tricarboxylate transporter receptor subunit TctC
MKPVARCICGGVAAALLAYVPGAVVAQTYPTKTIRLILPFPPGGPTDMLGRALAQRLGDQLGRQVVPDNRSGAGGNLGLELAAKAPADGYTMVLSSPLITISPSLYAKLNYDPAKDLAPVSLAGIVQNALLVHPSVPAKTFKELLALARSAPGKLMYGSGGIGGTNHLAPSLLQSLTHTKMVHVPYKGTVPALVGMIAGEVDMIFMAVPSAVPHVRSGKARALFVASEHRAQVLPEVPTAREAGLDNFEVETWYGILTPAGVPHDIVTRLNHEIVKALGTAEMKEKLASVGIEPRTNTPEQFASFIRSETVRFAKVIKDAGIKAD